MVKATAAARNRTAAKPPASCQRRPAASYLGTAEDRPATEEAAMSLPRRVLFAVALVSSLPTSRFNLVMATLALRPQSGK
jgi:hypothetical protein